MILKDSIMINKSLPSVYSIASDIENQHKFIRGYQPAKIIERREDGSIVVERTAEVDKKVMKWTSLAKFEENRSIEFEQLEGKLKGMKIKWLFENEGAETRVTIVHVLDIKVPFIGWFAEKYIAKPAIEKLTRNVLEGLKEKMGDTIQ